MKIRKRQSLLAKMLSSRIFILFLLIILIFFGVIVIRKNREASHLDEKISQLKEEILSLEDKSKELANLIEYFNIPSHLEKEAKSRLNLKKEGEKVVIIKEEGEAGDQGKESQEEETEKSEQKTSKISDLFKWLKSLFGK